MRSELQKAFPTRYIYSINLAALQNNATDYDSDALIKEDRHRSIIGNADDQVEEICRDLAANSKLKDGFHAIGLSQVFFAQLI